MFTFERKYSPGFRHMISIEKTKSTCEKRLVETTWVDLIKKEVGIK